MNFDKYTVIKDNKEGNKMETYYGKIKERLIEVVRRTNDMAEKKT